MQTNFPPKPEPHNDIQMMDSGHGFKLDPSTPTTTTTPEPNLAPVEISKLLKQVSDWNAKEEDFAYRVWLHKQLPSVYDSRDPQQAAAGARYKDEEDRLREQEQRLAGEQRQIKNDLAQTGAQTVDGQVRFPDGETLPAPDWRLLDYALWGSAALIAVAVTIVILLKRTNRAKHSRESAATPK